MDPNRWKQIDELVDRALDVDESERSAFVESRTENDPELRKAVCDLLEAQGKTSEFLQHSAMKIVAKAIAVDEPQAPDASLVDRKVANYRILKKIGAGGMGEVYLAFDEKMRRNVALKILPAEYGRQDERVRRFELEARAISKINHPNIVTLYDVGNADGINYIATEFVEGKTLRDLIGGKFKLRNVMANSIQICDALSAAHAQGIIHRDIKPENIMIRNDGYAKILDFGVAKLTEVGPETIRKIGNTTKGMIIGTPAYMSPAQVSGENVDHRTDIWGCGVVLYEFLTGQNPFKGKNRQATFHAILASTPAPPSSINPELTDDIDRILAKVLEKDPEMGYQNAADLRADLKRVKRELESSSSWTESGSSSVFAAGRNDRGRRGYLAGAAAAALVLLIAAGVWALFFRSKASAGPEWSKASSQQITNQPGTEFYPTLSPDGKDLAYAAEESGSFDIFLLRIGGKRPKNLTPGSPGDDHQPAFSPKGDLIAFRSERDGGGIYTIEVSGDNLKRVSDFGYHPSWSPDGKQLVVSSWGRDRPTVRASPGMSLEIIDVQSGARRKLLELEATFPAWSPNGHRIAYWFYTGTFGRRDIATIPVNGGPPVVVAKDFAVSNWNPVWAPDGKHLYFVSSRTGVMNFWRVGINEVSGEVLGEPEPVTTAATFGRHMTFSADGRRMAYVNTMDRSNVRGVAFDDKAGKPVGEPYWITEGDREASRAVLSPDGKTLVMRLIRPTQDDIVTYELETREWRDVTNDEPFDRYVRWSADGRRLFFGSDRNGGGQVWSSSADGTNLRQMTSYPVSEYSIGFPVAAPDGSRLAAFQKDTIFILNPIDGSEMERIPGSDGYDHLVPWDWSPDSKILAGILGKGEARYLGIYSFETRSFQEVLNINSLPAWLPDSRRVVYSVGSDIYLADVFTKRSEKIFTDPGIEIRSPFVSADGKLLYYTGGIEQSDIFLLDLPTAGSPHP